MHPPTRYHQTTPIKIQWTQSKQWLKLVQNNKIDTHHDIFAITHVNYSILQKKTPTQFQQMWSECKKRIRWKEAEKKCRVILMEIKKIDLEVGWRGANKEPLAEWERVHNWYVCHLLLDATIFPIKVRNSLLPPFCQTAAFVANLSLSISSLLRGVNLPSIHQLNSFAEQLMFHLVETNEALLE